VVIIHYRLEDGTFKGIMEENGIVFQRDLAGLRVKYVKAGRSFSLFFSEMCESL